jgi:hypothetical protein
MGVRESNGAFHPARIKTAAAGSWDFAITIPSGIAPNIWIFAPRLSVLDPNGATIPVEGSVIPMKIVGSASAQLLALSITGVR